MGGVPGVASPTTLFDRLPASPVDAAVRRAADRLPSGVKRRLAGPYNRLKTAQADRAFRSRRLPSRTPGPDAPEHVIVVVVDALRADAVDAETSPFLADRSMGAAVAPAPWTFPSVTSLVTGRYPHEHGSMRGSDAAERGATDLVLPPRLPDEVETLPGAFAGAGYETYGGFAFHMPFFALGGRFGTHALYDDAPAETVLSDFRDWFERREGERTFSYLHLGDLHEPVDPPPRYWGRYHVDRSVDGVTRWRYEADPDPGAEGERYRENRRNLYRAAVDYVDDRLAALRESIGDDVALVVTADHGEGLWERTAFDAARFADSRPAHCVDHGGTPYEPLTRVPLVVEGLGVDRLDGRASLIDVAPTLLDALGHPDAWETTGASLRSGVPDERVLLVEAARYGHEKKAAYWGEWKLLVSKADDEAIGFRLPTTDGRFGVAGTSTGALTGVPADLPLAVERQLSDALPPWPDGERADRRVSGIARDRLEDLGYA